MESKGNSTYVHEGGMSKMQSDLHAQSISTRSTCEEQTSVRLETQAARQIHVGIVGAGFAGLRCADVLLRNGFKVTIFEARSRVGGRVGQSDHLGHEVDLGPNWIHGTNNNPIMELAKKTKTKLHAWDEEQFIIDVDGKPLDATEVEEYGRLVWDDGVIANAFAHSNKDQNSIDPNRSLYDYFLEKAEHMFKDDIPEDEERKRTTFLRMASMWGSYIGSSVAEQSLRFFWLEECIEGENPFVAETYKKILDEVAKTAISEADIRLGCKVTGIQSLPDSTQQLPRIETADGKITEVDEVVMTAPLGYLKNNRNMFHPPLPPRLSEAITNIGYGCLDKVYVSFPSAFWDIPMSSDKPNSNGIDPSNKTPNVTAKATPLHQPRSEHADLHYPGFTHWLNPRYAADTNPAQWDQQGMNLAALSSGCAHPTILYYTYGSCSQHIAKLVTNAKSEQQRNDILREFFEPYYSRLPHYDSTDPACTPKAFLATAWAMDEFAGYGSYANFQVGLEKGDEDIEVMRHGMPERSIWFAGEHTAPFIALGTSTGAYWSGENVAKRLIDAYGTERSSI